MSNILKWSLKNAIIGLSGLFCMIVVVSAFLAPMLASMKIFMVSDFLYEYLHKLCHNYSTNSLAILGHSVAICSRCIGAYIAATITLFLFLHKFKMNKIVFIILGTVSIVEIILEHYNYIFVNDFIRLIDGLFLGAFLGMTLIKILDWLEGKKGW